MSDAALGFHQAGPDAVPVHAARVSDPALARLRVVKLSDAAATLDVSERKLRRLMTVLNVPMVKAGQRTHGILLPQLERLVALLQRPAR